jgi:two-component system NtrC family sensor kinase
VRDTPELLRISAEGLDRIKKIVDDLRLFARADSGERTVTDVVEGIDSSLRLLGHRLSREGVAVVKHYEAVPAIEANPAQLNQVWMNLLTNALDALTGRCSPRIEVSVAPDGGRGVAVRIRDNGIGIEPTSLPRLFEPFFTTKPIGQGTGLGLSIAYGAVKAHGGTISIDSEREVGTVVVVWLPLDCTTLNIAVELDTPGLNANGRLGLREGR